jgi:hypothetical protein
MTFGVAKLHMIFCRLGIYRLRDSREIKLCDQDANERPQVLRVV